jgi:hypothetical protein
MVANGMPLPINRNIKTLMGAFGFSDGSSGAVTVQPMVQHRSAANGMHAAGAAAGIR